MTKIGVRNYQQINVVEKFRNLYGLTKKINLFTGKGVDASSNLIFSGLANQKLILIHFE
jgi:hypothetical protein